MELSSSTNLNRLLLLSIVIAVVSSDLLPEPNSPEGNASALRNSPEVRHVRSLKDVNYELLPAEGRHNNRQSYDYKSKPTRNQYNNHNRDSHNKRLKGGYHASDSYNSNSGYNIKSNYDRARRGKYGDSDHKKYGGQRGNKYGDRTQGGSEYGGKSGGSSEHHGGYGDQYERGRSSHGHGGYGHDAGYNDSGDYH